MFTSPIIRRHGSERAWTEHLATDGGMASLLDVVGGADLSAELRAALDDVRAALVEDVAESGLVTHQLHLAGRYPDIAVTDARDQLFALIEAQRRRADDQHIAKLAGHYVPDSGARLGILIAEGWNPVSARHPAWGRCPAPVAVVVVSDAMHELDYRLAWTHLPMGSAD